MKRLRPFQNPTKEDAPPSLETPGQGNLGTAFGLACPRVFHNYRYVWLGLSEIETGCLCYEQVIPTALSASPINTVCPAFARPETYCLQHASLHIPPPARRASAPCAADVLETRIIKALETVAMLVVEDPAYIPVFERLERELADIRSQNNAIERARQFLPMARQNEMR